MPQRRSHLPIPSSTTPAAAKRALPLHTPSTSTPTRQSKRLKTSPPTKTTPKKSPYFEHSTSEEPEAESAVEREESGYEDEDASAVPSPPTSDAEDDSSEAYNSSDDDNKKPVLKKRGRKPNSTTAPTAPGRRKKERKAEEQKHEQQPGNELWRPGVKSHLPPGSAIFIPLPRARSPGTTPYTATTIHPNTFSFLRDLRSHNDRAWLQRHDADYRTSQADWASFVDSLTQRIIASVDDTIPDLPHRDLTFRIYRDVRFSSDPTPYKTHFSAAWSRTGRKGPYAAYYVQVQPGGGSFLGGGVWHPEAGPLGLLRRAVDRRGERLKAVLGGEGMRREFLGGVRRGDEKGCVMRFVEMNRENALKTKPKVCVSLCVCCLRVVRSDVMCCGVKWCCGFYSSLGGCCCC